MPGIKKKWIKGHKNENEPATTGEEAGDEDKETNDGEEQMKDVTEPPKPKPVKKAAQASKGGMLKGLDGEVLLEKRKRFVPPAELKLNEWLESNLEQRTDETLPLSQLYNYYTELCQGEGWDVLDIPEFNKVIKGKFGKAFGLTEGSVLKGLLKERKLNQEKKKPRLGIRMKDVIHEAIQHYGNPSHGVRFFSLKQYVCTKYPALQIDIKPKVLKRALEMGVKFGQIDLVKGIGMMGFYRLPGEEEPKPKTEKDDKEESKDTKDTEEAEAKAKEGETDTETAGDSKEKTQEGSSEDKENKEEVAEEKKKQTKPKKVKPVEYSQLSYSNPKNVEDTFPLAITYQSAPKVVGIPKIRKYIADKYNEEVTDNRWRQVISKGVDNGLWEHISGSGISGSIHLLMDDFDPQSDQIEDQICAAIIACHEPKSASAGQIKKYVSQYHPDFKIDERPEKFKKALLRAVSKNMITQVSGLGASGSFQLTAPFMPTPAILAGEDDSDVEEESYQEPVYVSKGTKSRGVPKKAQEKFSSSSRKGKEKDTKKGKRGRQQRKSYNESSDEESEAAPAKKKKKGEAGKKSPAKSKSQSKKREPSPLTDEEEEELIEYTPRKSKSRGGSDKEKSQPKSKTPVKNSAPETPSPSKAKKESATVKESSTKSPSSKKRKVELEGDADDEGEEEMPPEYTPRKSRSRGGDTPEPKKEAVSKGRKTGKK